MECSFCKKTYANEYTLRTHQRTTKSCIKIQEELGIINVKKYACSFCNKQYTAKCSVDQHEARCKKTVSKIKTEIQHTVNKIIEEKEDKLDETESLLRTKTEEFEYELNLKEEKIKQLEEENKKLEQKIEQLIPHISNKTINNYDSSTNIVNNYTIYEVMTPERVDEYFKKHYNIDTLLGGQKALARLVADGFITEKNTYHCKDRSRQKFTLVDEQGKNVEDVDCRHVIQLTASGMPHVREVYEESLFSTEDEQVEEHLHTNYQSISKLDQDPAQFKHELSKVVPSSNEALAPKIKPTENYFEVMRQTAASIREECVERKKAKQALTAQKAKAKDGAEIEELQPKTIGGISLGKLDVYRQGYRKRKMEAERNGIREKEVEIKVPQALLELYHKNTAIREEYEAFIKS
jgi:hypothetical protein